MREILRELRPEMFTLGAALAVILVDLVLPTKGGGRAGRRWLGWFSGLLAGLVLLELAGAWGRLEEPVRLWDGLLVSDRLGLFFKAVFLLGVALTSVGSADFAVQRFRHVGEYYGLLFLSALGMMLMASAGDLITLYLGLELTTLSLYVLAAYAKQSPRSGEAGLKYVVLGATSSAVYLYGTSLVYGIAGTTRLGELVQGITPVSGLSPGLAAAGLLIVAALGFKMAAAPFHMWAPDVYQGAPTPITGFLSTASKAAGFAALMRVLLGPTVDASPPWTGLIIALAATSMVVGNLVALSQRDIKRMLAYSGVAQAGYALVGVAAASHLGVLATAFFLAQYLFTNLGAFLIVTMVGTTTGDDQITSYNGLSRRNPVLALVLLLFLLSLGGIPPLSGFWGKLYLFWAAAESGLYGLVLLGVLASVLSLYYYLMVARAMYIEPAGERGSVRLQVGPVLAILICIAVVIGMAYPAPLVALARGAAASVF